MQGPGGHLRRMDDEKPVSDPDPLQRREPATGERGDHQASPPGVAIPGEDEPNAPDDPGRPDEPEPGDHPAP